MFYPPVRMLISKGDDQSLLVSLTQSLQEVSAITGRMWLRTGAGEAKWRSSLQWFIDGYKHTDFICLKTNIKTMFIIPLKTDRGVWTVDGSQFQTGGYGNNHVKYSINLAVYSSSFCNSIQGRYSSNTYGVNSIKQYKIWLISEWRKWLFKGRGVDGFIIGLAY